MKAKTAVFDLVAVLCLLTAGSAWGKVIHVDDDAPTKGDGTSWTTAYRFLQDALTDAKAAGEAVEVRVAQGIYRPDMSRYFPSGSRIRSDTFGLFDGLTLLGGFAGVGAFDPNARDVGLYETVLSGDLDGNDEEASSPVQMRDTPTRADNSYHVVSYNEGDTKGGEISAELDGFVIIGGYAFVRMTGGPPAPSLPEHCGGGLFVLGAGVEPPQGITIRNCKFRHNYAESVGGGIYCSWSNLTLEECALEGNGTVGWGAGIYIPTMGHTLLSNCRMEGNETERNGGGLYLASEIVATLRDCLLLHNAADAGGGMYLEGIAVLSNCLFRGNLASGSGGGIVNSGALESENCQYVANDALYGGAILMSGSSSPAIFTRNVFAGNRAQEGGAIWTDRESPQLLNCSASQNRASRGAFLRDATATSTKPVFHGLVEVTNCTIQNGDDAICNTHAEIIIRYTTLSGGQAAVYDPYATVTWGGGNLDADPCFADAGYWDPNGTLDDPNDDFFVEGDYHLKSEAGRWDPASESWVQDDVTSPCIDAGDPNSPIGDEPFPNGGRINMGAYGGTAEASKSYFDEPVSDTIIAGDINGDGNVDWLDLDILASHWLQAGQ
ncbi:MAG: right-handed parallel beta-helix repeat-containing protein [Phycisphaerales bacterium]